MLNKDEIVRYIQAYLRSRKLVRNTHRSESDVRDLIAKYELAFRTEEGVNYDWVIEYANSRITSSNEAIEHLESKADAMMRYLAGGVALLGAVFSYGPMKNHLDWLIPFIPSAVALVAAMYAAAKTTHPEPHSSTPIIKEAFEYANRCNQDAQVLFMRSSVLVEFELAQLATMKAHFVRLALIEFVLAVFWAAIVAIGLLCIRYVLPASDPYQSWLVSLVVVGFGLSLVGGWWLWEVWNQRRRLAAQLDDWAEQLLAG